MTAGKRLLAAAAIVAAAQAGYVAWAIEGRARLLRDGTEVRLKVEPVDPRDLLRGDYVRLGYEITSIDAADVSNPDGIEIETNATEIHVRLARGADGYWRVSRSSIGSPPGTPPSEAEADVIGTIVSSGRDERGAAFYRVDYGIGRFYLPEGTGKAIERDMRARTRSFSVIAAVGASGAVQVKALMEGDRKLFEEPPY